MSDKNVTNINNNNNSQRILSQSSVRVGNNGKKRSIDDIIDHMTADLQSYEGQYIVLGSPHSNPQHIWSEYNSNNHSVPPANPVINHGTQPAGVAQVQVSQVVGNLPIFLQQSSPPASQSYDLHDRNVDFQTQQLFYTNPATRVQDSTSGAGTGSEMIGMVDVGGGNFVNVVFNTSGNPRGSLHPQYAATPNMLPQHQTSIPSPDNTNVGYVYPQHQQMLNNANQMRDYGLFNKESSTSNPPTQQPNRQLIENLVGNWLPNQSGTYSPFGGAAGRPSHSIDNDNVGVLLNNSSSGISTLPGIVNNNNNRKPRAVAEVRPMRPTYSDVLTKSPPPMNSSSSVKTSSSSSPSNTQSGNSTPKSETRRHNNNKANKTGGNKESFGNSKNSSSTLRRQLSSSSDDNNSSSSRLMSNIHKWMSIEELTPPQSGSEQNYDAVLDDSTSGLSYDNDSGKRGEKKQKKRSTKQKVGDEKMESFSSDKVGGLGFMSNSNNSHNNNSNNSSNGSKKSLPINNNFLRSRSNVEKNLSKSSKKGISKEDSKTGLSSMSSSKRSQRSGKRRNCQTYIGMLWNKWQHYTLLFASWFFNLLWDVLALSSRLFIHLVAVSFEYSLSMLRCGKVYIHGIFGSKTSTNFNNSNNNRFKSGQHETLNGSSKRSWWKFWDRNKKPTRPEKPHTTGGLTNNMAIPTTGDEAIRRLLSCKGKDPYSILGVTRHCTDDDIKKYYKRQAVLVHPDKNSQPGAEEAFKILVHAFELIGEPERRSRYDHCVAETHQMEHAWTELNDLLTQLHQKMEYTANTIRCTNCGKRHRRVPVQRPCYAARFCAQCKIHHSAREGDIWAESWIMGFVWHYYACMEGQIYNITEWATCQAENLQHLKANSHAVQYRIVLGKQQQNQHEPQHSQQQTPPPQQQQRQSEPDLEEFLNNLYSQSNTNNTNQGSGESNTSRHRRKTKRKK